MAAVELDIVDLPRVPKTPFPVRLPPVILALSLPEPKPFPILAPDLIKTLLIQRSSLI
jgi:hypothetical protein